MNIKSLTIILLFLFAQQTIAVSQIVLEKLNSNKQTTIAVGQKIAIKIPTTSANDSCECYELLTGIFRGYKADTVTMRIDKAVRVYNPDVKTGVRIRTDYNHSLGCTESKVFAGNAFSISKYKKAKHKLDDAGGVLMLLAGAQALFIGPLLSKNARKTSDKIAIGAFFVGFTMVVAKKKRTYFLQQPKKGGQALWEIVR